MKILKNIAVLFIVLLSFSCKKENSPSLLLIDPQDIEISMKSGDIKEFRLRCSSNTNLKSLQITSKIENSYTTIILDTSLSSTSFVMNYEYKAPSVLDKTNYKLTFILTDIDNNRTEIPKFIIVSPTDLILKEKSGNVMYSRLSGKFDAYNLENITPIYSTQADLSTIHIKDYSIDTINHNTLSKKWISMAGLNFIRFNDFDYANATYLSVRKAYEAGIKNPILDNIKEEDIILTKLNKANPDSGFIALRIVFVIDSDSTLSDRYIFNVKK
jgi:hypothetical protein